jgi:hypothetical protein
LVLGTTTLKYLQDFSGDGSGTSVVGDDPVIRDLRIQRAPQALQFTQCFGWIAGLQQRAFGVATCARDDFFDGTVEVNYSAAFSQVPAVFLAKNRPATRRHDNTVLLGQIVDNRRFPVTETLLPFHVKNPRNFGPSATLNFMIGVKKRHRQSVGKLSAYRAFANRH